MFKKRIRQITLFLAILGPGIITAFADNDAGGVATYSVAASKFGYQILTILIPVTLVLAITQEIGARIAVMSGKGLGDLIRERFGIKTSIFIFIFLFIVNVSVVTQNVGGIKAALSLLGLDYRIFLPLLLGVLFFVLLKATYARIERFFLVLLFFYVAYIISAVLAKPDWSLAFQSLFIPQGKITFDYLFTSIAVLGTTITAWGQFFINSYVKDKHLTPSKLKYEQIEVYIGAFLTDFLSFFMIIAVVATLFIHNIVIENAAQASFAMKPFAGDLASVLFGVGLFVAGFLGCAIVPLSTAYAFSEFFGYEGSLDITELKRTRLFYGMFLVQIIIATIIIFLPQVNLFQITLYISFFNGLMLPLIFYFLYRFANDEEIMREYKNTKLQNFFLVGSAIVISVAGLLGVIGLLIGL
ncbi:divalent metal cation transporter [Candidatus Roizmanbacteria bacterium]|nr:divalent metal cation transporter [Candidatus Roizmanbacteria bacterium]